MGKSNIASLGKEDLLWAFKAIWGDNPAFTYKAASALAAMYVMYYIENNEILEDDPRHMQETLCCERGACDMEEAKKLVDYAIAAVDNYAYSTEYPTENRLFSEEYFVEHSGDPDFIEALRAKMVG